MSFGSVDYVAVILGAVLNVVLGMLWYGPLFGNLWLKLIEKKKEDISGSPWMYVFSFVAAVVGALRLFSLLKVRQDLTC